MPSRQCESSALSTAAPSSLLILVGRTPLLHHFYGEVLVPGAVVGELLAVRSPQEVKDWMSHPPSWFTLTPVTEQEITPVTDELGLEANAPPSHWPNGFAQLSSGETRRPDSGDPDSR